MKKYMQNAVALANKGKVAIGSALTTAMVLPMVAMAQTAPTTATELAQSVDLGEAKTAMFIIFGLLIGVGVSIWVGNLIAKRFRPM